MKRFWAVLLTLAICLAALPSLAATTKALDAAPLAADTAAHDGTIRVWLSTLAGQSYTVTIAGDYTIDVQGKQHPVQTTQPTQEPQQT